MNLSIEIIDTIYAELSESTATYQDAANSEALADADLKSMVAEATAGGHIIGENQQLRDAAAREMFADQFRALNEMHIDTIAKRLRLDLARIEIERVKMGLRVMELAA